METFWFIAVAFMITMYSLLDGFDLGAGAIHPFAARDGRERQGPFSLDNVTADLALTGGSLRCRHARQNLQNRQNRSASEVLSVV